MSVLWIQGSCPKFEIRDEELARRMKLMRPVYRGEDGELAYMVVPNPRNVAFTWSPEKLRNCTSAYEVARLETYHRCGYIALFKPSIDEVLARVPDHVLEHANAFLTITHEDTVACFSDGDGHRTTTIFYTCDVADEEQTQHFDGIAAFLDYKFNKDQS